MLLPYQEIWRFVGWFNSLSQLHLLKYCISTWKLWARYYPKADIVLPRSTRIDLQMLWFSWTKTFGDPKGRMPWINCCGTSKVTQSHLDKFSFLMQYNYDCAFTITWTSSFSKRFSLWLECCMFSFIRVDLFFGFGWDDAHILFYANSCVGCMLWIMTFGTSFSIE